MSKELTGINQPLPCPFCGAKPEVDKAKGYLYSRQGITHLGTQVSIYCTKCSADLSWCIEDTPDMTTDEMYQMVLNMWNRRAT